MQVNSQITITTSAGDTLTGTCMDLSATGMQLSVDRALSLGEELKTRLEPASDQFPPLETVCEYQLKWRLPSRNLQRILAYEQGCLKNLAFFP